MNSLKEAFSKQNLLKNLNFFGELNLGLILTAVGIVYFKNPNHLPLAAHPACPSCWPTCSPRSMWAALCGSSTWCWWYWGSCSSA